MNREQVIKAREEDIQKSMVWGGFDMNMEWVGNKIAGGHSTIREKRLWAYRFHKMDGNLKSKINTLIVRKIEEDKIIK